MKIISLNLWCGRAFESLMDFLKTESKDADVFCFQEVVESVDRKTYQGVKTNLLQELRQLLPDFSYWFVPTITGFAVAIDEAVPKRINFDLSFGQVIFYRKNFQVRDQKDHLLYQLPDPTAPDRFSDSSIVLQSLQVNYLGKDYSILNFHGTPYPGSKLDTDYRLEHSRKIKHILKQSKDEKILMGDFNLMPDTKSIAILESEMRNLIKEFDIKNTRSKLNPYFGKPNVQYFADYTFVSQDLRVKKFQVPEVEVSDHLPIILEIE